jgi:hypothetical protein
LKVVTPLTPALSPAEGEGVILSSLSGPGIENVIAGAQSFKVLVKIGNFLPDSAALTPL